MQFGYNPYNAQEPLGQALQSIAAAMFSRGSGKNPELEASQISAHNAQAKHSLASADKLNQEVEQQRQVFSSADKSRFHGAVALLTAKGMPEKKADMVAYRILFGSDANPNVPMPAPYQEAGGYAGNPTEAQRMQANSENSAIEGIAASMLTPSNKLGVNGGGGNADQIAGAIGKFGNQQFRNDADIGNFGAKTIATSMLQDGHNPNSNFNNGVSINNLTGVVSGNDNNNVQIKNETNKANSYVAKNNSGIRVDNANIKRTDTQTKLLENTGNNGGTRIANPNSPTGWSNVLPDGRLLDGAVPPYNPSSGGGANGNKPSGVFYSVDNPQDIYDALDTVMGTSAIKSGKKTIQPAYPLPVDVKNAVATRASQLALAQGFKGKISHENLIQAIGDVNASNPEAFSYNKSVPNSWGSMLPDEHVKSSHYADSGIANLMAGDKSATSKQPAVQSKSSAPDLQTFMTAAKKANPTATEAELKDYYMKKYGA